MLSLTKNRLGILRRVKEKERVAFFFSSGFFSRWCDDLGGEIHSLNMIWLARQRSIIIFVILHCHYKYQMSWKVLFSRSAWMDSNGRRHILLLLTIKRVLEREKEHYLSRWNILLTPTSNNMLLSWNLLREMSTTQYELWILDWKNRINSTQVFNSFFINMIIHIY